MIDQLNLSVLSKALSDGLISEDEFSEILQELDMHPDASIESFLQSRAGLSDVQISLLVAATERATHGDTRETAASGSPPAGDDARGGLVAGDADGGRANDRDNRAAAGDETGSAVVQIEIDTIDHDPSSVPAARDVPTATFDSDTAGADPSAGAMPQFSAGGSAAGSEDRTVEVFAIGEELDREARLRYQLKREIARGGLGRIILAHDVLLGRDVAVKELLTDKRQSARRIERFFAEAQITGQLEHPSIVPVHSLGVNSDGQPFYAMKLIEGKTLATVIRRFHATDSADPNREIERHKLLETLVDVCNAMAFAHQHGVVHRDLKPLNVMVGDFGETQIVDWGLAKSIAGAEAAERTRDAVGQLRREGVLNIDSADAGDASGVRSRGPGTGARSGSGPVRPSQREATRDGTILGTLSYMAPEQARGLAADVDHRADIFALGATLYEILTGRAPYVGSQSQLIEMARTAQFARPRQIGTDVPPALDAICCKAMAEKQDDRYASASEMAEDIQRWQAGEPTSVYAEPWAQRAVRWMRRHKSLCIASATAILVLATALGAWRFMQAERIATLQHEGSTLFQQGLVAFDADEYETAMARFSEASGMVASEASLADLQDQISTWRQRAAERLSRQKAADAALRRMNLLRRHEKDAVIYGLLETATGAEIRIPRAKQAVTAALALFDRTPDDTTPPALDADVYSATEKTDITLALDRLRWIHAATLATPLSNRSREENRQAARDAVLYLERHFGNKPSRAYYLARARFLEIAGLADAHRAALADAQATPPRTATDFYLAGMQEYEQNRYKAAAAFFAESAKQNPNAFWTQYFLGECYVHLRRYADAVTALTASANRDADFLFVYLLRGVAYGQLGESQAADADFRRAEQIVAQRKEDSHIQSHEYALLVNRAITRMRLGRSDEAVGDLKQAIAIAPHEANAYADLAELYRLLGNDGEANVVLEEALRAVPDSAQLHWMRALLRSEQGEIAAAYDDVETGLRLAAPAGPLFGKLLVEKGRILHMQKDYAAAIQAYDAAIAARPELLDALLLSASALLDSARPGAAGDVYPQAIALYDRYLKESDIESRAYAAADANFVEPGGAASDESELPSLFDNPRRRLAAVFRDRGIARATVGDDAGALEDFARADDLISELPAAAGAKNRRWADMRARRGWILLLNAQKQALADFEAILKENPKDFEALVGRGYARVKLGDWKLATLDAAAAVQLAPKRPGVLFNAAGIFAQASVAVVEESTPAEAAEKSTEFHEKAVALLRECFTACRNDKERAFYLRSARTDPALNPLKSRPALAALLEEFAAGERRP